MITITNTIPETLRAGIVTAYGVQTAPSPAPLSRMLAGLVVQISAGDFPPQHLKDSVRAMLRSGGFKPSGRNKPASEYLAQAAREDRFPLINNLVDVNNFISLESGLPASLLRLDALGSAAVLRFGRAGERYVFNESGQEIELEGLICACDAEGTPVGNPVKDAMRGKISTETKSVVGIVYAPSNFPQDQLSALLDLFARLLTDHCGASKTERQQA